MVDFVSEAEFSGVYGGEGKKSLKVTGGGSDSRDGSEEKGFDVTTLRGPNAVDVVNKGTVENTPTKSSSSVDGKCGIPC